MSKIYLVRHGETDWNKEDRCQGCTDTDLNSEGIRQAELVAERLMREEIHVIYCSNLRRAYRTAQIIADKFGLNVIKSEALNEISFGDWEGLTFEEIRKRKDYDYNAWRLSPHTAVFPGEGSLDNVYNRVMKYVDEIILRNSGKNILIVSHGGVIKLIILGLLGIELEAYNKFYIANTSVSIVHIDKDKRYLKTLNDTCHVGSVLERKNY
ncbi:histidine phosphatase family protein [Acetivibrio clariflavus]|uniref:Fructose-2,6-bisphosphatase n=1 Tax=Acetivibrio clariflavus (strain DSM 19732 / NBRC 101661 / EBR45) TaxID=720554 RepID=G8LUT1_ACECE|nr:histidine phosphatase family protein [Acetivibrio clariflavus]AEV68461.1 fructose-2,6-bisphosphatase [Acetivibrio clariflavus DSM 19732]